jgi:hypothetical protein
MQFKTHKVFKWIGLTFGGILLAALLIIVLVVADVLGCFHEPPFLLETSGTSVIVYVDRFGDYVSAVGHIRISDASSGKVIYEAVAKDRDRVPCFLNFRFSVGENPTQMVDWKGDTYRIVEPQEKNTFTLQPGVKYRLRVWGDSWTYREDSFKF